MGAEHTNKTNFIPWKSPIHFTAGKSNEIHYKREYDL